MKENQSTLTNGEERTEEERQTLATLARSLDESESDTVVLRSDLQKLLLSSDTILDGSLSRLNESKERGGRGNEEGDNSNSNSNNDSNLSSFTKMQIEDIHSAYRNIANKLSTTESNVQSVRLHLCNIEARQQLHNSPAVSSGKQFKEDHQQQLQQQLRAFGGDNHKVKDVFEAEVRRVKRELEGVAGERDRLREEKERALSELEMERAMRLSGSLSVDRVTCNNSKLERRLKEAKKDLERETQLRLAMEQSQSSLLARLEDVEQLLEQERAQAVQLEKECEGLKRECVRAGHDLEEESRLRRESEQGVEGFRQQLDKERQCVKQLMAERDLIDSALIQWKKDYLAMDTELKQKTPLIQQLQEREGEWKDRVADLESKVKQCSAELSEWKTKHETDTQQLHTQYSEALDKQREAMGGDSVLQRERERNRELEGKMGELRVQMGELERQQTLDCEKLRDQARQKEAEAKRARAELEELRRMQQKSMEDKERLLAQVNSTVDSLTQERMSLQYALEEAKLEVSKALQGKEYQERENVRLLEEMSCMQVRQGASDEMQSSLVHLTGQKSQLTQQNNTLQAKVKSLSEEIDALAPFKQQCAMLKRQNAAYEAQFTKLNTELSCVKMELQKSDAQARQLREKSAMSEEDHSLINNLRGEVKEANREVEQLQQQVSSLTEDNRTLKASLEDTSTELNSKLSIIHDIEKQRALAREDRARQHDEMVRDYEDRLEVMRRDHLKDRDLLNGKWKREIAEAKKARDEAVERANQSAHLVAELRSRMAQLESELGKQREQTRSVRMAMDNSHKLRQSNLELTERLQTLQQQLDQIEKQKKQYMREGLQQAQTVTSFVAQLKQLQGEMLHLANVNEQTAQLAKKYEENAAAEKEERERLETRCGLLANRCKELESHLVDVTLNSSQHNHSDTKRENSRGVAVSKQLDKQIESSVRLSQVPSWRKQTTPSSGTARNRGDAQQPGKEREKERAIGVGGVLGGAEKEDEEERNVSRCGSVSNTSYDLESERERALETTRRARQMVQESRDTMKRLSERMSLLETQPHPFSPSPPPFSPQSHLS